MKVVNNTQTIYGIAGKFFMPDQPLPIDDVMSENPVLKRWIKEKKFSVVKETTKTISDNENIQEAFTALLETEPSMTKLRNFAKRNGINISEAKTEEDAIAIINACIKVAAI